LKLANIVLLVILTGLYSCDNYNRLLKSTDYDLKLTKAKEYFDKKYYIKSSQLYEELIPYVKGTEKAEEVYYYYTWSEYHLGDYILSQYHFKNYARQFPTGKHVEECYFMNAYCYFLNSPNYKLDQTNTKSAIKEFQAFVDMYPESNRIDTCNLLIDKLRFKLEKKDYEIIKQYHKLSEWKAAIVSAKDYAKDYPNSPYNEEIAFLTIDSYYLLAINSIFNKKEERINGAIENYVKFLALYPNSSYLSRAEVIYNSCMRLKNNLD
jgi:outer membrane protein assembly factor BamD